MDLDELTAVLAGPRPDRAAVLASFRRKHRRRKVRQRLCSAGAVAVGATVTVALVTLGPWRPRGPVALSPPGCTQASLAHSLVRARQAGASILIAFESPIGSTAGSGYTAVVLHSVRTLSGPVVSSGTVAWTDGTAVGGADDPAARGTETTGGRVLAIAWPAALAGSPVGPVLHAAPVVGENVMFPASGCTDVADLPRPGVVTSAGAPAGGIDATTLYAVPLRTVEEAAVSPAGGSQPGGQATPSRAAAAPGGGKSPGSGATNAASDQQGGASPSSAAHSGSKQDSGKGSSASSGKSQGNGSGSSGGSDQQ